MCELLSCEVITKQIRHFWFRTPWVSRALLECFFLYFNDATEISWNIFTGNRWSRRLADITCHYDLLYVLVIFIKLGHHWLMLTGQMEFVPSFVFFSRKQSKKDQTATGSGIQVLICRRPGIELWWSVSLLTSLLFFDDICSLGDPNVSNMLNQVAPFHHPKERVGRHLSTKLNPNRFGPGERAAAIGCPRYGWWAKSCTST